MRESYVRTDTVLDRILGRKVEDIAFAKQQRPLAVIRQAATAADPPRDMLAVLKRDTVALIAEVKKASPSKGVLIEDFDPVAIGRVYAEHGAAAISVLTDEPFFQGHLDYLTAVREAVTMPVLRKDFVIDPYQVYEGRAAGADAMLLIVAALNDTQLADLHSLILELGMTPLVEVHNEAEVERALRVQPRLLGVNNRDLKTFQVDMMTTARLAAQVPGDVLLVAESGLSTAADVAAMGAAGAQAVLVGESLVRAGDIASVVRDFSRQPFKGRAV